MYCPGSYSLFLDFSFRHQFPWKRMSRLCYNLIPMNNLISVLSLTLRPHTHFLNPLLSLSLWNMQVCKNACVFLLACDWEEQEGASVHSWCRDQERDFSIWQFSNLQKKSANSSYGIIKIRKETIIRLETSFLTFSLSVRDVAYSTDNRGQEIESLCTMFWVDLKRGCCPKIVGRYTPMCIFINVNLHQV